MSSHGLMNYRHQRETFFRLEISLITKPKLFVRIVVYLMQTGSADWGQSTRRLLFHPPTIFYVWHNLIFMIHSRLISIILYIMLLFLTIAYPNKCKVLNYLLKCSMINGRVFLYPFLRKNFSSNYMFIKTQKDKL